MTGHVSVKRKIKTQVDFATKCVRVFFYLCNYFCFECWNYVVVNSSIKAEEWLVSDTQYLWVVLFAPLNLGRGNFNIRSNTLAEVF